MLLLSELKVGAIVKGLAPEGIAKIASIEWYGDQAAKVIFEDSQGNVKNRLLYKTDEPMLEIVEHGRSWSFSADGSMFRLVSEAYRIRLAYLFDPYLAIHTSQGKRMREVGSV